MDIILKKDRILELANKGYTTTGIAKELNTNTRYVRKVKNKREIYPFKKDKSEYKIKELILADIHIPHENKTALKVALDYSVEYKPDIIVLLGDFIDFYAISSFNKDPKHMPIEDEIELAKSKLREIRELNPKSQIIYMCANHEIRLLKYLWSKAPELAGLKSLQLQEILDFDKIDIKYVNNDKHIEEYGIPFSIGKLFHLHGHEYKGSAFAVNIARNIYLNSQENVIVGHFHKTQEYIFKKLNGDVCGCWSIGCLCDLYASYLPVNQWNHGFCTVEYDEEGNFSVSNKKIIDKNIY